MKIVSIIDKLIKYLDITNVVKDILTYSSKRIKEYTESLKDGKTEEKPTA